MNKTLYEMQNTHKCVRCGDTYRHYTDKAGYCDSKDCHKKYIKKLEKLENERKDNF